MGNSFAGFWDFFPGQAGWGKPPVWGLNTVIQSKAESVAAGARYYGFFQISETLNVTRVRADTRGIVDGAVHRAGKAVVYNQYLDTRLDPAYDMAFALE